MDGCFSSTGLSGIMVWLNDGNNRCHMMGLVTCSYFQILFRIRFFFGIKFENEQYCKSVMSRSSFTI